MSKGPVYRCARCGKGIACTPDDPVIAAKGGIFHRSCAYQGNTSRKKRKTGSARINTKRERRCGCGEVVEDGSVECRSCAEDRLAREGGDNE